MRVIIRFDYVNSSWEITIHEDNRYLSVNGKTLREAFANLKNDQLVKQIQTWFEIKAK